MSNPYDKPSPKSRVNITLDLQTNGVSEKKELPFKVLAIGDFSAGNSTLPISQRPHFEVTKATINAVMKTLRPSLQLSIPDRIEPDNEEFTANIQFLGMDDFHPDHLVQQLPQMQRLYSMRNLLKELRASLNDNLQLRMALTDIAARPEQLVALLNDLKKLKK